MALRSSGFRTFRISMAAKTSSYTEYSRHGAFHGEWNKDLTSVTRKDMMLAMGHSKMERLVQGVDEMQL